ncbi:MAG: hypothetical protein R3E97_21975 [Candidatus Eisenbacteria bacterium]
MISSLIENWGEDRTDGAFPSPPSLPNGTAWLDAFGADELALVADQLREPAGSRERLAGRIRDRLAIDGTEGRVVRLGSAHEKPFSTPARTPTRPSRGGRRSGSISST